MQIAVKESTQASSENLNVFLRLIDQAPKKKPPSSVTENGEEEPIVVITEQASQSKIEEEKLQVSPAATETEQATADHFGEQIFDSIPLDERLDGSSLDDIELLITQ